MAAKRFKEAEITALAEKLIASPAALAELDPLMAFLSDADGKVALRLSAIHALRRIFTHYFHSGILSGSGLHDTSLSTEDSVAGKKRKRAEASGANDALAAWLKQRFYALLTILMEIITETPTEKSSSKKSKKSGEMEEDERESRLTLGIAALRTFIHFSANAVSATQQQKEKGQHVSMMVLQAFLQLTLCAEEAEVGSEGLEACYRALAAFRADFSDDYDDIRHYTMKCIALMAKQKYAMANAANSGKTGGKGEGKEGKAAHVWDRRFQACSVDTFARNAVSLMLDITLPTSEALWRQTEHETLLQQSWAEAIPGVYDFPAETKEEDGEAPGVKTYSLSDDSDDEFGLNIKLTPTPVEENRGDGAMLPSGSSGAAARKSSKSAGRAAAEAKATSAGSNTTQKFGHSKSAKSTDGAFVPVYFDLTEQRRAFAEAWLAILQLRTAPDVTRRILTAMPTDILPIMPERYPLLLADFLTACTDNGGANALLALQSLFLLMQHYGLEYPNFYPRLYALFTPEMVGAKYRSRFFTLLDMFLSSAILPAYLVAAFMKRAARLAITTSTPMCMFALPFIYNCLKRHPACTPLIHRVRPLAAGRTFEFPAPADPFVPTDDNPATCNALESSLWEIIALQQHYYAPISHLARVFTREITKQEYDIADYAKGIYSSFISEELERKVKQQGVEKLAEVPFEFTEPARGLLGVWDGKGVVDPEPTYLTSLIIDFAA